jgi:predicted ATPase
MITRIEAMRYRCFEQLDVVIEPYQVIAGVNGSGKTTLLDIPVLLGDMLEGDVPAAFLQVPAINGSPRAQSLQELVHHGRGEFFSFAIEVKLPEHIAEELINPDRRQVPKNILANPQKAPRAMRYELRLQIFNQSLQVSDEFLYLIPESSTHPGSLQSIGQAHSSWREVIVREGGQPAKIAPEFQSKRKMSIRLDPEMLALDNVPADLEQFPATTWFREMLTRGMMHYAIDGSALRRACPPGRPMSSLMPNGANLPWLVMALKRDRPDFFEAWVSHVQTALPNVVNIDAVEREEDHHAYLRVEYEGGYTVTSSGLSDGTLHILALTILPYLGKVPQLICIEEPENGIHPRAIETVLQSLSSVYDSQVLVTTHSPVVLAHTDLAAVMLMQQQDGAAIAVHGSDHPRLQDWRGSIDLGSLLAAGVLS